MIRDDPENAVAAASGFASGFASGCSKLDCFNDERSAILKFPREDRKDRILIDDDIFLINDFTACSQQSEKSKFET
jgi:hypothetical protein